MKIETLLKTSALAGLGMALMPAVANANLVSDGGFETPSLGSGLYQQYNAGSSVGAWLVDSGSVDLVNTSVIVAHSGSQSLDLSGDSLGFITQSLSTVANQQYMLDFFMMGNYYEPPSVKTLEVYWNGSLAGTFTFDTGASHTWAEHSLILTATGSSTVLGFKDLSVGGTDRAGVELDDVWVEPTAVPEPSTILAGAMLLLPFGAGVIRRFQKRG